MVSSQVHAWLITDLVTSLIRILLAADVAHGPRKPKFLSSSMPSIHQGVAGLKTAPQ